jgi:hypothetical protein
MMRIEGWLALGLAVGLTLQAEDLTTLDGRTFPSATFRRLDDDRLSVRHAGGETSLYFFEVPEPLRRRLGFDSEAALKRLTLEAARLRGTAVNGAPVLLQPNPGPALLPAARPEVDLVRSARWTGLVPPAPATQLPPVGSGETVPVWDLVNHYRSDPAGSDARYKKRAFRVTGVVERIDKSLAPRMVRIFLESPDPAVRPVCEWRIDDKIPAFHTVRDGRTLVGENNRSKWKLLEAGEAVTFEVRGGGLEDGLVELKQAIRKP